MIEKLFLYTLITTFSLSCSKQPSTKWKLIWEDNFSNKNHLDTSKWSYINRNYALKREGTTFNMSSCVKIQEGNLVLTTFHIKNKNGDDSAVGCGVQTKNKKSIRYGKLEIRAKFESAQGINSAIWMLANKPKYGNDNPEYKKYAHYNGEIDIVEHINFSTNIYHTIHSYFTYKLKINDPPQKIKLQRDVSKYIIYGVELHENKIIFFVDGKKTFEYPKILTDKPGQYPFDQDYYLMIEHGLGKEGSWQGTINLKNLPINLYVDWVKFYKKIE